MSWMLHAQTWHRASAFRTTLFELLWRQIKMSWTGKVTVRLMSKPEIIATVYAEYREMHLVIMGGLWYFVLNIELLEWALVPNKKVLMERTSPALS